MIYSSSSYNAQIHGQSASYYMKRQGYIALAGFAKLLMVTKRARGRINAAIISHDRSSLISFPNFVMTTASTRITVTLTSSVGIGLLQGYQLNRILVWKNPEAYPKDGGYQVLQGLYAIGSGGLLGKGLGQSIQKIQYHM